MEATPYDYLLTALGFTAAKVNLLIFLSNKFLHVFFLLPCAHNCVARCFLI